MGRTSLKTRRQRRGAASALTERNSAIENMNSALKRKFESIERKAGDERDDNLRYYYQLGKELVDIRDNPEKFGRNGYQLLETALATQARTLRKSAAFATTYSESEFEQLLTRKDPLANYAIHWGHVGYLLGLNTRAKRNEWAVKAVSELLDPPALSKAIQREENGGRAATAHGRTHAMPKTISAQIRQMLEVSRVWLAKNNDVWNGESNSVLANVLGEAPDKLTQQHADDLMEIVKLSKQMVRASKRNLRTVGKVLSHVKSAIRAQGRAATAEEVPSGRQQRVVDLNDAAPTRRRGGTLAGATS